MPSGNDEQKTKTVDISGATFKSSICKRQSSRRLQSCAHCIGGQALSYISSFIVSFARNQRGV